VNALPRSTCFVWISLAAIAIALLGRDAAAQAPLNAEITPPELQGVGITERLNERIPLDLIFKDETGQVIKLGDLLKPGRPVILTLNFYRCPMLCNLTLNGMVNSLNDIEWTAGKEFDIVTVSFNPAEGPEIAEVKKRAYLTAYTRDTVKDGWHFLTGDQVNIDALCGATGFGYRKISDDDFAHTSTIMFVTPDGRLSRYMNNVVFEPRDMRLALVEASEGSIGSPMDKFLLFMCYHYDPAKGSYAASAVKIMRLGGVVTVIVLAAGLGMLWWRCSGTPSSNSDIFASGQAGNLS
jgi:protein SCO1/2